VNTGHSIEDIMAIRETIEGLKNEEAVMQNRMATLMYHVSFLSGNKNKSAAEKRAFVRACPAADCRGFLSTQWKCGLCNVKVCKECHEIKNDNTDTEHECKPENVETAKMIMKECKPCPKCAAFIFKIDGCDQMWCTECQTTFSWRTGRVEEGRTHNPHYYAWLRTQNGGNAPREVGDVPCGGVPNWDRYMRAFANRFNTSQYGYGINHGRPTNFVINNLMGTFGLIHRLYGHIQAVEIPRYHVDNTDFRELRAKYMMKDIPEYYFKSELQRIDKGVQKANDISQVLQTFQLICSDLLQRLYEVKSEDEATELMREFKAVRTYSNANMMPISKWYHCVVPIITEKWQIESGAAYARGKKPPTILT